MKSKLSMALLGLGFLVGCSSQPATIDSFKPGLSFSAEQAWGLMIGKWFGSQLTSDGFRREWIAIRRPDGQYRITFRYYDADGTYRESIEFGEWGVDYPIYFSIFRGWVEDGGIKDANPYDPYNRDAYRILSLDEKSMTYQAISNQDIYTLTRVPDDFVFPADQP
jgi:hypothetical protein